MENTQPQMTSEEMIKAIYENTLKTKNYMKWQLYITIALVVIPLLAAVVMIPIAINALGSTYGSLIQLQ